MSKGREDMSNSRAFLEMQGGGQAIVEDLGAHLTSGGPGLDNGPGNLPMNRSQSKGPSY